MHSILLRCQLRVLAVFFCLLFVVTAVSGLMQDINHQDASRQQEVSQQKSHFWKVIAGEESGVAPGVGNTLARDIRSTDNISDFRGDSSRYGGITDAIGFDPFDERGLNCSECGPLSQQVQNNIQLIHHGGINKLIQAHQSVKNDNTIHLTPFNTPVIMYVILLYAFAGNLSLFAAHQIAKQNKNYTAHKLSDLTWLENGNHDGAKVWLIVLSPVVTVVLVHMSNGREEKFMNDIDTFFPEQAALIRDIDRRLTKMPEGVNKTTVKIARNAVVRELQEQVSSGKALDDSQELLSKLQATQDFLKGRQEAKKELGI